MASLRKKYSTHIESQGRGDEPPVMSPPAAEPAPAVETKPVEPMVESSPAEEAAQNALRQRLKEMENAEALQRQQQPPQPPPQQQQQPEMPAAVAEWLSRHPEYTNPNDQIAQVEISLATMKAARDGLTWNDDDFLPSIERHLGLRQHTQPNGNGRAESAPAPARPVTVDRPPPQRMSVPVSAPPTREVPSMRTGRPVSYRAPLTRDELPQGAQPIATAPERTSQPVIVHEASGQGHWALHYNGAWRKVAPFKDWRTGSVSWRMDGTEVSNPVAWSYPQKKA